MDCSGTRRFDTRVMTQENAAPQERIKPRRKFETQMSFPKVDQRRYRRDYILDLERTGKFRSDAGKGQRTWGKG
jgi:hypothetical protein